MKILAIETSCDETAIAILACEGDPQKATFTVLGNALLSQIEVHKEYGGVFPALAKREHAKNLVPILEAALEEAELLREDTQAIPEEMHNKISEILSREPGLTEAFFDFVGECEPPAIDAIAVTTGPGLEPALWVGINFARALSLIWGKPLVAVNHLEGHILAALAKQEGGIFSIGQVKTPVLALLISGGHTELVLMKKWLEYELVGQTRDDAVGEAFDKVARMLGLPYPGGPEISCLAEQARAEFQDVRRPTSDVGRLTSNTWEKLPRPMIDSGTCDFSFAGLKTAVRNLLYKEHILISGRPDVDKNIVVDEEKEGKKKAIAREFEDAVADVLWKKTAQALDQTDAKTLAIGGGVSANTHIRRVFTEKIKSEYPEVKLCISTDMLTTDNAIMIAIAGFYRAPRGDFSTPDSLRANGNRSLAL